LKAPETERLKLKYDELISNFAFRFNLRRYTVAPVAAATAAVHRTLLGARNQFDRNGNRYRNDGEIDGDEQ